MSFVNRGSCLVFDVKPRYGNRMSVAELIKHVTALPAREREKLFLAILALDEEYSTSRTKQTKHVKWPDIEARAKKIFHNRVLPNLVLLEREVVGCNL
jgi:hypothetical protein